MRPIACRSALMDAARHADRTTMGADRISMIPRDGPGELAKAVLGVLGTAIVRQLEPAGTT